MRSPFPLQASLGLLLLSSTPLFSADIQLPTASEDFRNYDPQVEAIELFGEILAELGPQERTAVMQLVTAIQKGEARISPPRLRQLLGAIHWQKWRARVLRLLIYRSGALDIFPDKSSPWLPFVHDFLLFFLDHLPDERLIERLATQIELSVVGDKGRRLVALADRTPSLQKIGQIMARHPSIPPELRQPLQVLENDIRTASRDELVAFITGDLGAEVIRRHRVNFDPEVLAEASVGAVIRVTLTLDGDTVPRVGVCKVVKPYAVTALREELVILDKLTRFFEEHGEFYQLGKMPLSQMFEEARMALSKEIQVLQEQAHLKEAYLYYRDDPRVQIPEIYPLSTPNVTFMAFIDGGKIIDAFPNNPTARAKLAGRLDDIMTLDVLFSRRPKTIFHGDPHAGNVFFVRDPEDPYRIGLLDWGLRGELTRGQRQQLIQLMLGILLRDRKRIRNHVGVLMEEGMPEDPEKVAEVRAMTEEVLKGSRSQDHFSLLWELVTRLTKAGHSLNFNLVLFIKAQVTIEGILKELDPDLKRGRRAIRRLTGRVFRETPKRLLNTVYFPGWTSHSYPSMVSNEDVRDLEFYLIGRGIGRLGGHIWKGLRFPFRW